MKEELEEGKTKTAGRAQKGQDVYAGAKRLEGREVQ